MYWEFIIRSVCVTCRITKRAASAFYKEQSRISVIFFHPHINFYRKRLKNRVPSWNFFPQVICILTLLMDGSTFRRIRCSCAGSNVSHMGSKTDAPKSLHERRVHYANNFHLVCKFWIQYVSIKQQHNLSWQYHVSKEGGDWKVKCKPAY